MAHLILIDQGPPDLVYLGCKTSDNNSSSTVTFTGCPFGTPRGDRIIIIGIGTFSDNIASVTIAGNSAALASGSTAKTPSPFPYCGGIYSLALPTGTSGNISLTASGTTSIANSPSVQIYAAYGLQSATSVDGASAIQGVPTNSVNVAVKNAGIVVAFTLFQVIGGSPSVIWGGVSKDNQTEYGPNQVSSASYGPAPSASTLTVSDTLGADSRAPDLSVASFR